jgi:hypothetical protein
VSYLQKRKRTEGLVLSVSDQRRDDWIERPELKYGRWSHPVPESKDADLLTDLCTMFQIVTVFRSKG